LKLSYFTSVVSSFTCTMLGPGVLNELGSWIS